MSRLTADCLNMNDIFWSNYKPGTHMTVFQHASAHSCQSFKKQIEVGTKQVKDRLRLSGPTTPSQHGWCRPTSSHWAPPDPQVWAGTQTTTGGRSHHSHRSSSWWPRWLHRGDTGSWIPDGSHWPSPCHNGLETELPLRPATPTAPELDSWWGDQSICCTSSHLPQLILLQAFCCPDVLYPGVMCNLLLAG